MTSAISTHNAEHYQWGDAFDGWHLLKLDEFSVIEERVPAGGMEAMHYHQISRQFFYIIDGQGTMVFKDKKVELQTGEGLEIPPGIAHQFSNFSQSEVRFLVISVPKSHGDRITV